MPKLRCPNGTRRNKTTGKCEPKNKSMSKSSPKSNNKTVKNLDKCAKGVKMPEHRIENIIKFEKSIDDATGMSKNAEYYKKMETILKSLCFPKNTQWQNTGTFTVARYQAIKA
jgi:hypothetical protein